MQSKISKRWLAVAIAALAAGAFSADEDVARGSLYSTVEQNCGSMMGGIGTGYVELWPDGCFHSWSIFNRGPWAYRGDFLTDPNFRQDRFVLGEMNADAMQFFIRACPPGGKPVARRLSLKGSQLNVYSTSWMQNVEGISYDYTFPGATLAYVDSALPVKVTGQFFSPVIPHDLKTSGTPGFYAVFTVKNTSAQPQEISLATYLRNPLARGGAAADRGAEARKLRTTVNTEKDTTYLTMQTDSAMPFKSTLGSMCLSVSGGEPSWIASDFGEYLTGRTIQINPWQQRHETSLREFRETGRLPNTGDQPCPIKLGSLTVGGGSMPNMQAQPVEMANKKAELDKLTDAEIARILEQARNIASLRSILQEAQAVNPDLLVPEKKGRELVEILRQAIAQYAGGDGKAANWGDNMLCSTLTLKPGEERQVRLTLSWYFPNHLSPKGERNMGHMYSNWFKDAEEVNRFLTANFSDFSSRVSSFRKTLLDTTLPVDLMTSVSAQLNTLIAGSWWTQDGLMGLWEGLGCCGLSSATVMEQGSHPVTALFPEYEKAWTDMAITWQNDVNGRMYILYPSDLTKGNKNQGYGYVDRNCHFVWSICRDYLWFGDRKYLDTYYPHIIKSISVFEGMDSDGDGLPDKHTESNTYDTWSLQGVPSYFCSLWIGTLRCGIRMAEDAGDTANASKWQTLLDKAVRSFNAKIWNGEYYSLWVDGTLRDEGCMADQLDGDLYTNLMGLGNTLPASRVREVLGVIYKYNYDFEHGLHNAVYPPGRQPRMPTFQNVQVDGKWPGTEYAIAAQMIDNGMVDEGMNIVSAVKQRYIRAGRFQDFEECGGRYNRPMSVWAVLLASTGFKIDTPKQILTIAPPLKENPLKAPWVSATGWGQFIRTAGTFEMTCSNGEAGFRELRVNVPVTQAQLDGKALSCKVRSEDGLTVLKFDQPLTLKTGQTLNLK